MRKLKQTSYLKSLAIYVDRVIKEEAKLSSLLKKAKEYSFTISDTMLKIEQLIEIEQEAKRKKEAKKCSSGSKKSSVG